MPESKQLKIFWTEKALQNTIFIKKYLELNFSNKEILTFYSLLVSFGKAVSMFPKIYPVTAKKERSGELY